MIELQLLEIELHKNLNAPAAMLDEENAVLIVKKILEIQSELKDLQEQYDCFWNNYEKKNSGLIEKAKATSSDPAGVTLGECCSSSKSCRNE
ncbi:MAG: hypothetical protein K0Q73_7241 [Paenibacillus sp.]|jgi:hypothetical protein|nr:hypothetical protein [Paenibacillus sp.]